ncbi:MFS transporter [Enterococcus villorum]|uniref:MFS transporter n=2 Tax=Enterococcus villorum TaxID=112904 RepID=A0A511J1X0_9ENTE|nr:MFS transporter [Enterococcus villorum]EOH92683.1 drug:H+ antiporter-2 (14 Spanner) (DHA2) family drug resistance MFS transporter [Enterococcus villorum ATCC 700913]EOW75591.1 major facilitator superfamily transporter [Enterococcus villorum ATCC 700913]GEL92015.1 MFS transporter [Enterococcus villorum]
MTKQKHLLLVPAVIATGMMSFAGVLIETAMNVTFPTLIKQFQLTTAQVQWVTTIYLLMISIIVPLSTYLTRNFSLRSLFLLSNLLFLVGIIVDFFSPTYLVLLLGRLLQGAATGIALPLMFHIILTFAPMNRRGAMIGIGTLTTAIAPAIGPSYGGILTSNFTWNHIFLFLIPVLLLSLGIGLFAIPNMPVQKSGRLDMLSVFSLCLLFSGSLTFLSMLGQPLSWLALLIAGIGAILFYQRSKTAEYPLINLSIFSNKTFRLFLFSFLIYQFLLLGVSFVLPNFIQIVQGNSPFIAGIAMLPGATIGAVLSPFSGKLLDQHGPKKPIFSGLLLALIGWSALVFLIGHVSLPLLITCHFIYMIGIGLSYSNMMTTGMNALSDEYQSDGNAVFNTLQQFSGAVATSLVAVIINLVQSHADLSYQAATTLGSKSALGVLLILLIIRFLLFIRYCFTPKKRV